MAQRKIVELYTLVMEDKIHLANPEYLGLRAQMDDFFFYDVAIEEIKATKKALSELDRVGLVPDEDDPDVLITEMEIMGDFLAEDATEYPDVMQAINGYFDPDSRLTPEQREAKLKKRRMVVAEEFQYNLPYNLLKEFVEFHLENFERDSNIYALLTEKEVLAIKEYVRWRSVEDFQNKQKTIHLTTYKEHKDRRLVDIMQDANDWVFDGLEDLGAVAGHCELGHALRYQYFAKSGTLGRSIVFGSKCISDFFNVSPELIKELQKSQEYLLREVKVTIFAHKKGYANQIYKFLRFNGTHEDIISSMKEMVKSKKFEGTQYAEWQGHIVSFVRNNIPLTRQMLMKYQNLVTAYKTFLQGEQEKTDIEKYVTLLKGSSYPREAIESAVRGKAEGKSANVVSKCASILIKEGQFNHPLLIAYLSSYTTINKVLDYIKDKTDSSLHTVARYISVERTFIKDTQRGVLRLVATEDIATEDMKMFRTIFTKDVSDYIANLLEYTQATKTYNDAFYSVEATQTVDEVNGIAPFLLRTMEHLMKNVYTLQSEGVQGAFTYIKEGAKVPKTIEKSLTLVTFPLTGMRTPTHEDGGNVNTSADEGVYASTVGSEDSSSGESTFSVQELPNCTFEKDVDPFIYNVMCVLHSVKNTNIVPIKSFNMGDFHLKVIATICSSGKATDKQKNILIKEYHVVLDNIRRAMKTGVIPSSEKTLEIIKTLKSRAVLSDAQKHYIDKANSAILNAKNAELSTNNDF